MVLLGEGEETGGFRCLLAPLLLLKDNTIYFCFIHHRASCGEKGKVSTKN